jgi:hypothetical protein
MQAEARVIDGQRLFKGVDGSQAGVKSWKDYRNLRDELIETGRLIDGSDPELLVFAENVAFSPSALPPSRWAAVRTWRIEEGSGYRQDLR